MRTLLLAVALSWTTVALGASAGAARIPLVQGLTRVAAVYDTRGDQEQVLSVIEANEEAVDFGVAFRDPSSTPPTSIMGIRRVRREDLAKSNRLNIVFQEGDSSTFPGSTLSHLSAATLAELKQSGKAALVFAHAPALDSVSWVAFGALQVPTGRKYYRGTLQRDTAKPASMQVLVNGELTVLPVIHAAGTFTVGTDRVDLALSVLDDPANPLILALTLGKRGGVTVRIDYPTAQPQSASLAIALGGGDCRTELHGIYFDFAKATLLPQSKPALHAVGELMRGNPGWQVRIEGHTDSVGTDAYNQALSQQRAAAVVAALVAGEKVRAQRLASTGFGESRPVADNKTMQGRAANRRVELSRTCP